MSNCLELTSDFVGLLSQGRALVSSTQTAVTSPQEDARSHEAAGLLYQLDDSEWQLLLREVSSEALVCTLWFMKDLELARTVVRNFSERAAAALTEELVLRFGGKNPDDATAQDAQTGRDGLREVLEVLARLQAEGQIAPCG